MALVKKLYAKKFVAAVLVRFEVDGLVVRLAMVLGVDCVKHDKITW